MGREKTIRPRPADKKPGEAADNCRCKEAAEKKPLELVKLAISDLAFWKKAKKK